MSYHPTLIKIDPKHTTFDQVDRCTLIQAIQNGQSNVVRLLLEREVDVNAAKQNGWTALMSASHNGRCDVLRLLLERKADVNAVTQDGWTALMLASQNGHYDVARVLLERKAEVNTARQNGGTAIMVASENGHSNVVSLLLECEADVNAAQQDGRTALMLASQNGHCDVVRLLLERKAEVNVANQDGGAALILASQNSHDHIGKMLLEKEAEVNAAQLDGGTVLRLPSLNGDCDVARLLLEKKADVNATMQDGWTALMGASENGHCGIVKMLLEKEAEVNATAQDGYTALTLASWAGHCDVARLLLEKRANVNATMHNGWTAIMLASVNGHCDTVRLLLEREADFNAAKQGGGTALTVASLHGHCDVARLLLDKKANVNAAERNGWTALMLASGNGHCETVKLLLEREADVNATNQDGGTALTVASLHGHCDVARLLLEKKANVNAAEPNGWTALILASMNGHCETVRLLLAREANFNAAEQDGLTALMFASLFGHCNVVGLLLQSEADVNATKQGGWTALMLATFEGHCNVARLLLERQADVNATDQDGGTALTVASQLGHCDVARLLLDKKANVNAAKQNGWTALMLASENGHCETVKLLLEREADVNATNQDGGTALTVASLDGHCNVARLLLEKKANVNAAEQNGWTALMLASGNGHCETVKLLLEREAALKAADSHGWTALMLASVKGHCDVVKLLVGMGADVNAAANVRESALRSSGLEGICDGFGLLLGKGCDWNQIIQDGCTTPWLSSEKGYSDLMRVRVELDNDLNIARQDGLNALMVACINGHCDVVRVLLGSKAEVNATIQSGCTALMLASQNGHCDIVKELLEMGAEVNATTLNGSTALMLASEQSHCNVVQLLLKEQIDIDVMDCQVQTAAMLPSRKGQYNTTKVLIDVGSNVLYEKNKYGETAAMYITFAEMANRYFRESVKHVLQNPLSPKSDYDMCNASFALIGAFLYNTSIESLDGRFSKSALWEAVLYAYLPNPFYVYRKWNSYLFLPYQGVEGKISLHTMATAVLCKLPHTALHTVAAHHREILVNMLGQTPMHLLAMENHIIGDMEDKILLLTETVGFSFGDRDNNGRIPYHIACLCLNAQLLLCGLRLDLNFKMHILVQDHLGKTPLGYMTYLLCDPSVSSHGPVLKLLSARKTLGILEESMGLVLGLKRQKKILTGSKDAVHMLGGYFEADMTVTKLAEVMKKAKKLSFITGDVASLFKCSTRGIVSMPTKHHLVIGIVNLLEVIGTEMGKINPLFECVPELKGSVQEYTKCGELDEIDTSMKLVNFQDNFNIGIIKHGINISVMVLPLEQTSVPLELFSLMELPQISVDSAITLTIKESKEAYSNLPEVNKLLTYLFSSVQLCSEFWQIFLKALDTEATRSYTKRNNFVIENCKRKHGFVGMLNISCQLGDCIQLISVDIAPNMVRDNLDGYTALMRPRQCEDIELGDDVFMSVELSSAKKDWDFLKFLHPEVMCGYALVKMLRSVAGTFQTEQGRVYSAEDILPSYMLKSALLWILDPDEKCSKIYTNLDIEGIFHSEPRSNYIDDVFDVCQDLLLLDSDVSFLSICDKLRLFGVIWKKCIAGGDNLTVRERILPYVLATRCPDRQVQTGLDLQWMQEKWNLRVEDISYQHEMIYSRTFYTQPEAERTCIKYGFENESAGRLSHHKISYPEIGDETARKCRLWAQRVVRVLPHLLQYDGWTSDERDIITGVRNYYLPAQEVYARDKDLTIAFCGVLEAMLE